MVEKWRLSDMTTVLGALFTLAYATDNFLANITDHNDFVYQRYMDDNP
jgi:hypothetical protein